MRTTISYPRVSTTRNLRRIVPALGALALSLAAGAYLLPRAATPGVAEAAPTASASFGPVLADIGPHAPGAFVPRGARVKPHNVFVAQAAAAPAPRVAQAPLPPERPSELATAAHADLSEPETGTAPVVDVPLPPRRPQELTVATRAPAPEQAVAIARAPAPEQAPQPPAPVRAALPAQPPRQMARTTAVPGAPPDNRGFFERLFGGAPQAAAPQATNRAPRETMAYAAAPDSGGLFGGLRSAVAPVNPAARYDRYTAIYDISAHTVYMPDGARLEAHSGLREHLDDPRYVHLRMRGPTPPHLYELTPREALFHGVEALRLNPIGGGGRTIYNRAGLLAHTYMLGPNGDSNGCVSFRDYHAFLAAYKRGEVRRLAVVSRL